MEKNIGTEITGKTLFQLAKFQKFSVLGRICSSVMHEVNNHLTGVTGYAQLLLAQDRSKEVAAELEKINTSAIKCQRLIADLRRFSRLGGEEKEFNNINFVIKSSLDLIRHQFTKKSIRLVESYAEDIPPVEVDTPALEQAFLNIIQNSFEVLDDKEGCLSITTLKENGRIVALFEDNGPGLSEDALTHLFTPLFTTKERLHCLGLGLTVTKMVVEAHSGSTEVNNVPHGGACVRLSLPCPPDET